MGKLGPITTIVFHGGLFLASGLFASAQPLPKSPVQAPKPEEPAIQPSRYISSDKDDEYIQSLAASFAISSRASDVFGQPQDSEAKPIVRQPLRPNSPSAELSIPFSSIVPLIKISTVMAREKRFLVRDRSFSQGDQFTIPYRGKTIRVMVTEVSANKVEFKNLDTGEIASQQQNVLPNGMTPGTSGITAPGMIPNSPNAPLEIDAGPAPTGTVPNR